MAAIGAARVWVLVPMIFAAVCFSHCLALSPTPFGTIPVSVCPEDRTHSLTCQAATLKLFYGALTALREDLVLSSSLSRAHTLTILDGVCGMDTTLLDAIEAFLNRIADGEAIPQELLEHLSSNEVAQAVRLRVCEPGDNLSRH